MRLSLNLLACFVLHGAVPIHAMQPVSSSEDVVVLLFHTESVDRLQVRSRSASVRLCQTCVEQKGPVLLDLHLQGPAMLDGESKPLRFIALKGEAQVTTGGGHRAAAAGLWRIDVDHGHIRVRIEVPRERYVEAVLAAEASPAEPAESLKALAVTARSFAASSAKRHVDDALCDTTHCQALRFEAVSQPVRDAVWSTSGETIWYGGRKVPAYFSQHCGGSTEDASSAWGGPASPWLVSHVDTWCARVPSQWHASLAEQDVRRALAEEGFQVAGPIQDLSLLSRDRSGRVQQIRLRSGNAVQTLPAATLRFALNRSLGWNQLRSDRYQLMRVGDRIVFEGSGFGHGVGLCQAGAAVMATAGKSYREILQNYFPGASVRVREHDAGWLSLPANGFVLRTTVRDTTIAGEAAQAFAEARSRWNAAPRSAPTITIFPTTETFRQATGQSGWELAATQGSHIATQPVDVLRIHGGAGPIFRHEFLHSFVEADASPAAPLWLREGLVAVLNGESCSAAATSSPDAIDADLRSASSLSQSQQGHAAACALTKRYIAAQGMQAVQSMLRRP